MKAKGSFIKYISGICMIAVLSGCSLFVPQNESVNTSAAAEEDDFKQAQLDKIEHDNAILAFAVNIDGGDIDTIAREGDNEPLYFDYKSNGFPISTAWVKSDCSIFTIDRNGNGIIDDGTELISFDYEYDYLDNILSQFSKLDENADGVFSEADSEFKNILLWQDKNENAVCDADDKVTSIGDSGITEIELAYEPKSEFDDNGIEHIASFSIKKDTEIINAEAVLLDILSFKTIETDILPVPDDIEILPDIENYGCARSLHQAMVRDDHLKLLVLKLCVESDKEERNKLFDEIMYTWAGVADNPVDGRGPYIDDGRKIDALNVFYNLTAGFLDENGNASPIPGKEDAEDMLNVYNNIKGTFYRDAMLSIFAKYKDFDNVDKNDPEIVYETLISIAKRENEPEIVEYLEEKLQEIE